MINAPGLLRYQYYVRCQLSVEYTHDVLGIKSTPKCRRLVVGVMIDLLDLRFIFGWHRCSTEIKMLCYNLEGRWFDPSWCQ